MPFRRPLLVLTLLLAHSAAAQSSGRRRCESLGGNCTSNYSGGQQDVSCAGGTVMVANASTTTGTDATTCCICPGGTTMAYADEFLGFRFQADGITRDSSGSLVWSAAAPGGLAFVMNRTIFSGSTNPTEMQDHLYFVYRDGFMDRDDVENVTARHRTCHLVLEVAGSGAPGFWSRNFTQRPNRVKLQSRRPRGTGIGTMDPLDQNLYANRKEKVVDVVGM
jgi:hypothetical protein